MSVARGRVGPAAGASSLTPRVADGGIRVIPSSRSRWRLTSSHVWGFAAVAVPFIGLLGPRLSAIDLTYQVRAGDIMLRTHHLIRTDPFSFTAVGRTWVDQQWGAQVLFALIHRAGGWEGLLLARAVLGGLIFSLVFLACRAAGARTKWAAGLSLASFLVAFPGLILRPQILGMALFALTGWLVADRRRHPAVLWMVPLIVALWANVHGSFFFGPVSVGLAYVEDRSHHSPKAGRTLGVAAASVVAATLNPFGIGVWRYALDLSTNPQITRTIQEWQPTTIRSLPGVLFFASVLAVLAFLVWREIPTPWPSLVKMALFFCFGLFAVRGVYWWALAVPPVIAPLLSRRSTLAARGPHDRPSLANTAFAAGIVVLAIALLPWWRVGGGGSEALLGDAPLGITRHLHQLLEPTDRVFDPQLWGSWFEYALPTHPTFVDSRIEVFPDAVWRDYDVVSTGYPGWQDVLDRWHIDVVVANPRQQAGLIPRIEEDQGWRLAYRDADGFVFVRGG